MGNACVTQLITRMYGAWPGKSACCTLSVWQPSVGCFADCPSQDMIGHRRRSRVPCASRSEPACGSRETKVCMLVCGGNPQEGFGFEPLCASLRPKGMRNVPTPPNLKRAAPRSRPPPAASIYAGDVQSRAAGVLRPAFSAAPGDAPGAVGRAAPAAARQGQGALEKSGPSPATPCGPTTSNSSAVL